MPFRPDLLRARVKLRSILANHKISREYDPSQEAMEFKGIRDKLRLATETVASPVIAVRSPNGGFFFSVQTGRDHVIDTS